MTLKRDLERIRRESEHVPGWFQLTDAIVHKLMLGMLGVTSVFGGFLIVVRLAIINEPAWAWTVLEWLGGTTIVLVLVIRVIDMLQVILYLPGGTHQEYWRMFLGYIALIILFVGVLFGTVFAHDHVGH